jgi:hypothetical protein
MKICSECNAFFDGRKWTNTCQYPRSNSHKLDQTLCVACKRIRDRVVFGTVYLEGEVIAKRADEIMRMIQKEEEIERARNHCSRILDVNRDGQKMTIRTVNSLLAIHIAKQFKKAFKGKMEVFKDTPGHMPRNKQSEGTVSVRWIQSA